MSKGQTAVLAAMADGPHLLVLHKLDKKASVGTIKVNLLTFFALKDKKLIKLDWSEEAMAYYRLTSLGKRVAREQEKDSSVA